MIATAWARLSEELRGSVGIVTSTWPRSSSALVRPRSSRPTTIGHRSGGRFPRPARPPPRAGGSVRRFAVRPRAVSTATWTQSATAASSESRISIPATKSALLCAMPSIRQGSKVSGFTSRMRSMPKFLAIRTAAAMLTMSWGLTRTSIGQRGRRAAGPSARPSTPLRPAVAAPLPRSPPPRDHHPSPRKHVSCRFAFSAAAKPAFSTDFM